jgi:hypothetical protein
MNRHPNSASRLKDLGDIRCASDQRHHPNDDATDLKNVTAELT